MTSQAALCAATLTSTTVVGGSLVTGGSIATPINLALRTALNGLPHSSNTDFSSPAWQRWFHNISDALNKSAYLSIPNEWDTITFTGSNLSDIETRRHNDLQAIQGGAAGDYYHLSAAQYNYLLSMVASNNSLNSVLSGQTTLIASLTAVGLASYAATCSGNTTVWANLTAVGLASYAATCSGNTTVWANLTATGITQSNADVLLWLSF